MLLTCDRCHVTYTRYIYFSVFLRQYNFGFSVSCMRDFYYNIVYCCFIWCLLVSVYRCKQHLKLNIQTLLVAVFIGKLFFHVLMKWFILSTITVAICVRGRNIKINAWRNSCNPCNPCNSLTEHKQTPAWRGFWLLNILMENMFNFYFYTLLAFFCRKL